MADASGPCSEFEALQEHGFWTLQFPPTLEAQYLDDKVAERLRLIRLGAFFLIVLTNALLMSDWFMVPDQFQVALVLRVLIQTPLAIVGLLYIERARPAVREWLGLVMGLMTAGICSYLSVVSQDPLAPDYLVSLCMVMLFNGGVMRMRFWMAVRAAILILTIFLAAALLVADPPVAILWSSALVMVSSAVFALFSSYRSEHEDRANWLLSQHQKFLHEEVNDSNRQLDRLSRFDALTDLANRRHFDEFLQQVWSRAQCNGEEVALLMMDIDHFKSYNDHHGHTQGDLCIQAVASTLKRYLRQPEDLIARYGGEEFVAVLPGTSLAMAMAAAERIRQGVLALDLAHEASPGLKQVTLSIGVACLRADAAPASPVHLIACADGALYKAKAHGRNVVLAFDRQDAPATQAPAGRTASPVIEAPAAQSAHDALHQVVEQTRAQMDHPGSPLAFPRRLEQKFQQDGVFERLHYFAVCGLVAFVVFNGFLLTDYLLVQDVFWLAVKVRLGFFAPLALSLLYLCWFKRDWIMTKPPWLAEWLILISGVAAAASLGYILSASHSPMSQLYHAGLAVVIIYGNLVQRLRFWHAVTFSAMVMLIHVVGLWTLPAYNPKLTWPLLTLMAVSVMFTLMANHAMERDERRRYLLTLSQQSMLKALEDARQRLQTLSRVDALTGVFNRRHFHEYLHQVWQRAQHGSDDVAIIIVDVDHFKAFNDQYGHQAGDVCLSQVAQAMKAALRQPGDLVARLGGEEFIAVLPQANRAVAQAAAERVRQAVEALGIVTESSSAGGVVTVSVGVASWKAHHGQTNELMITAADQALYVAKRHGRNRVVTSSAEDGHPDPAERVEGFLAKA